VAPTISAVLVVPALAQDAPQPGLRPPEARVLTAALDPGTLGNELVRVTRDARQGIAQCFVRGFSRARRAQTATLAMAVRVDAGGRVTRARVSAADPIGRTAAPCVKEILLRSTLGVSTRFDAVLRLTVERDLGAREAAERMRGTRPPPSPLPAPPPPRRIAGVRFRIGPLVAAAADGDEVRLAEQALGTRTEAMRQCIERGVPEADDARSEYVVTFGADGRLVTVGSATPIAPPSVHECIRAALDGLALPPRGDRDRRVTRMRVIIDYRVHGPLDAPLERLP
jgi:hypothetical protein